MWAGVRLCIVIALAAVITYLLHKTTFLRAIIMVEVVDVGGCLQARI